ncbi:MAG: hypothetical protein U0805_12645 [Pirellulales bacterium]
MPEGEHIFLRRNNSDDSSTPMTFAERIARLKGSPLRMVCTPTRIDRDVVLEAYERFR